MKRMKENKKKQLGNGWKETCCGEGMYFKGYKPNKVGIRFF